MHKNFTFDEKIPVQSTLSQVFIGNLTSTETLTNRDLVFLNGNKQVILKQYKLSKDKKAFKKEVKILKKIKSLDIKQNGNFPLILSAKLSNNIGEILVSKTGMDMFTYLGIPKSLESQSTHKRLSEQQLSVFAMQIISQLEIIHRLGYCHGDIKFQNICYNQVNNTYSLVDFGNATKLF